MDEPLRLLVVDDEKTVGRALQRLLERDGHAVVFCETAEAARRATGHFDAAVFDIELPDGVGLDLAEELLAAGRVERAVFFSGTTDENARRRAAELGRFIEKRHGTDELVATLLGVYRDSDELRLAACAECRTPSPTQPPPTQKRRRSR
jgi:DNA-binding response OmpR family regulator